MDYSKIISKKARDIKPSGIRKYFDIAEKLGNVISLGVGEPDFHTPWVIRREAIRTLERGKTFYTANSGLMPLRKAISDYTSRKTGVEYDPDGEIIVTVGGSEAIDLAVRAIVEPGDEHRLPPRQLARRQRAQLVTADVHRAGDHFQLPGDALEDRALAGAGHTDENDI